MSEAKKVPLKLNPLPRPTEGEMRYHNNIVDSGKFPKHQEKVDALRLARIGVVTGDKFTQDVALERWNRTVEEPTEKYSSAKLLLDVEGADNREEVT